MNTDRTSLMARVSSVVLAVLPRSSRGRFLAVGVMVSAVGNGMFTAVSMVYFVGMVGLPVVSVGVALSVAAVCALAGAMPLGWLGDRFGAGRVYLCLVFVRAIGYGSFVLVNDVASYLVVTCMVTTADKSASAMQQVMVGAIEEDADRTRALASLNMLRATGLFMGFLIAGMALTIHSRLVYTVLFLANTVSFLALAFATLPIARDPVLGSANRARAGHGCGRAVLADHRYVALSFGGALLGIYQSLIYVVIPMWLTTRDNGQAFLIPVMMATNTMIAMLSQIPIARKVVGWQRSRLMMTISSIPLTLACLVFVAAESSTATTVLVLAIAVLLTIGECLHVVAGWELSYLLAPQESRAQYLSFFGMGMTLQQVAVPVLGATALLVAGDAGWLALAGVFLLGGTIVWLATTTRRVPRAVGPPFKQRGGPPQWS